MHVVLNPYVMLCRKKYFILNNDITEALDGNETLSDIICEQVGRSITMIINNYDGEYS